MGLRPFCAYSLLEPRRRRQAGADQRHDLEQPPHGVFGREARNRGFDFPALGRFRRHQGFEPTEYAHPIVEPILKQTYGLMVFEEHILQVATEFAGLNLGAADVLRRALNKQKASMIRTMKREFYASARIQWRREEEIDTVWGLLEGFSGFMFHKAHSAEYAVEAFQGAWLKRRWPAHYLAALLSNYRGFYAHSPTMPQILYILEALRLGVGILPPCINRSRERFSVCYMDHVGKGAIRQPPIRDATVRERREITNYELRITKSRAKSVSYFVIRNS